MYYIEIYDYVMAYENLQTSADKTIVHNPSAIDVWFWEKVIKNVLFISNPKINLSKPSASPNVPISTLR